jgi:hypothetical protein
VHAQGLQLLHDDAVGARHRAWRVDVFDSEQPLSLAGTGVKVAGHGGHQRPIVQGAAGAGRKPANI